MSLAGDFLIEGRGTILRPFTAADITSEYLGWLNDPVVTRYSNQRFHRHDAATAARYLASFDGTPNLFVSVRRRQDSRPIGTMNAYLSQHHGTADVGIMIGDRSCWGGGFGQDAWNTLTDWLIDQPGIRKVSAGTLSVNAPMIRLAERSGMTFEGRRLRHEIVDGREADILFFGRFAAAHSARASDLLPESRSVT